MPKFSCWPVKAMRLLAFATGSAVLAAGLLGTMASAGQASVGRPPGHRAPARLTPAARVAAARFIAAEAAADGWHGTGMITGVISGVSEGPVGGACVTATGPAGSTTVATGPGGRYQIRGLRPGVYILRVDGCAHGGTRGNRVSYSLPGLPAVVTVLPDQVRALPRVTARPAGWYGLPRGRSPAQPLGAPGETGSISGRVTGHGRLLRGICAVAVKPVLGQSGPAPQATTSKTGEYRIRGLRPGRYQVLFRTGEPSCPGNANWLPQWYPYINSAYQPDQAVEVRVRAGRNTGHIDGKLELGGEIAGIVRTKAGRPIRGICVNFYSPYIINGPYIVNVASVSGITGHYALRGLFPGTYQVEFMIGCGTHGNYAAQWWRDEPSPARANSIKITRRQIVTGIDATLVPGAAITGTVRAKTAAATPLAGVCVNASDIQGGDYTATQTARNGTYRLEGLDTGTYQVSFDPTCSGFASANYLPAQRTVTVEAGRTRSGVDAYLRPAAGISGMVRDFAGRPVNSVCVNVMDMNNDYAFTSASGSYSITGVVPGKYAVSFGTDCGSPGSLAPQWYHNRPDADSADLVTFTAGKIDQNIDATLHPGGTLTGVLTSTTGQPINGECIGLAAQHGSLGPLTGGGFSTSHGQYLLQDLSPGEYQVSFNCAAGRYADQWFNAQPDSTTADYLAINPGVTTTLNEKLSQAGVITGRVTDKSGHPIANVCVYVANARNRLLIDQVNGGVMTGDHGRYDVGQLTPGRYFVQFVDCGTGVYGSQFYHGKDNESFATPVRVQAGQTTTGISDVLTVGGTISGRVTGPSGKPANGTCVGAYDAASLSFGFGFTGKTGRYTLRGLSSGRYSVSFSACYPESPNLASVTLPGLVRVVAPRAIAGVNVALAAGGSISGIVTGNSSSPGPQNQACVLAVPTNPNGSYPLVWTDPRGHYVMSGLAAGTYRVYLDDPGCDVYDFGVSGLAGQWYQNQPDQAAANLVTVSAAGTTTGISAALRPLGAITGQVTNLAHAGVGGECVTAIPFGAGRDPFSGTAPAPDIAISRVTGRYTMLDLAPGQYKIEFTVGCGDSGFATQWWNNASSAKSASVITVGFETVPGIDATLRR